MFINIRILNPQGEASNSLTIPDPNLDAKTGFKKTTNLLSVSSFYWTTPDRIC